jgi:hypothetical protein
MDRWNSLKQKLLNGEENGGFNSRPMHWISGSQYLGFNVDIMRDSLRWRLFGNEMRVSETRRSGADHWPSALGNETAEVRRMTVKDREDCTVPELRLCRLLSALFDAVALAGWMAFSELNTSATCVRLTLP